MSTINSNATGIIETADNTNTLALQTGGTTAVYVDSSQNVGIGTTAGITTVSNGLAINNATAANLPGLEIQTAGITRMYFNANNATSYIASVGTNPLVTYTNGSERMRIDSSGNVGIGTISPSQKLTVATAANSDIAIQLTNGLGSLKISDFSDGSTAFENTASYPMRYIINGTERMRIDSSGNLLVGTTTQATTNKDAFAFYTGAGAYQSFMHSTSASSGNYFAGFYYGGNSGAIGSISQNGTTGVLYNITSDYRLKNNPTPVTNAKDFVMGLQPKTWDWWDGSGKGVGFIAHEFMEVAKYSGHGEKDAVDADGKPVYQTIQPSSSEVMANLVAFIQELNATITDLQAKLKSAGVAGF